MRTSTFMNQMATDHMAWKWTAAAVTLAGLGAFVLQKVHPNKSSLKHHHGARLLVARQTAPRWSLIRKVFRAVEVLTNVVFLVGVVASFIQWPYVTTYFSCTFILPALLLHGGQVFSKPALVVAAATKLQALWAFVRSLPASFIALRLFFPRLLGSDPNRPFGNLSNPLLRQLGGKMTFLSKQHLSLPLPDIIRQSSWYAPVAGTLEQVDGRMMIEAFFKLLALAFVTYWLLSLILPCCFFGGSLLELCVSLSFPLFFKSSGREVDFQSTLFYYPEPSKVHKFLNVWDF